MQSMTKTPATVNNKALMAGLLGAAVLLLAVYYYMAARAERLDRQRRVDACVIQNGLDESRCEAIIDAVDYTLSHHPVDG
jgi:hypothetical protein